MSNLRAVLDAFEQKDGPLTLTELARQLNVSVNMIDEMLLFWVRKGKLRELNGAEVCRTCGIDGACPFVTQLPRRFMLVTAGDDSEDMGSCSCTTCR